MVNQNHSSPRILHIVSTVIISIFALFCLLPFMHVLAKSLSGTGAVATGAVAFFPKDITINTYRFVFRNGYFWSSFRNSIFITIVGTAIAIAITVMAAYPLSKPDFKGRKAILLLYVFSMLFYGGTIPTYVWMHSFGLLNTLWSQIIPLSLSQYNLFVMKTFFEGIPDSIEESARVDGADTFCILIKIILPLSKASLATISLFYAVSYWNGYYHAMIFVNQPNVKPLQLYLYELITTSQNLNEIDPAMASGLSASGVQSAAIIISALPMLILYPFVQKHFVHGLTFGSVKG